MITTDTDDTRWRFTKEKTIEFAWNIYSGELGLLKELP